MHKTIRKGGVSYDYVTEDSNDMVKVDSHNCRNVRNLNLFVVNRFYMKPYDQNQDFYI